MIAPMTIEALTDVAVALGFKLIVRVGLALPIGLDADRAALEVQYALLRGDEITFEGTARECSAFLIGWRDLRSSVPATKKDPALTVERSLPRDQRQALIADWARAAFGEAEATGLPQRGIRLLEEAIEAFQACGGDEAIAHKLVKFVFARPPGEVGQELGGVAVTALALAAAAGLSADEEECREIQRVLGNPLSEFTARNASKNAAGFKIKAP